METQERRADHPLIDALLKQGPQFSLFQAVHLLEKYCAQASPIGCAGPATGERIRLRPDASLSFAPQDVIAIEVVKPPEGEPRFLITTPVMGLYGTSSPLPTYYSEEILHSVGENEAVRSFLDMFHHRLLSLLYRAWAKYRYDFEFLREGKDEWTRRSYALVGIDASGPEREVGFPRLKLLTYAGLLACRSRSATRLEDLLKDVLGGIPVRIEQFIGRWLTLTDDQKIKVGKQNSELGVNMTMGSRVFDRSGKYRIALGPLTFPQFDRLLPGRDLYELVNKVVEFYARDRLEYDLELKLSEVPLLKLDSKDPRRIGLTSWLGGSGKTDASLILPVS